MRRDFENLTLIPCFGCDLSGFHFFDCLLYCTLFSVVEYTFAVRLWGLIMQLDGRRIFLV